MSIGSSPFQWDFKWPDQETFNAHRPCTKRNPLNTCTIPTTTLQSENNSFFSFNFLTWSFSVGVLGQLFLFKYICGFENERVKFERISRNI